jgi:Zn-dependent protease
VLLTFFELIQARPLIGLLTLGIVLAALLASLTFHEFSHALVALALGDQGQRKAGRLSLNPLRHLDPVGTLLILFLGFGWAKPVQTDPTHLKPSPTVGMALVGAAGPLSNLLLAVVVAVLIRTTRLPLYALPSTPFGLSVQSILGTAAYWLILFNVGLAVFNAIPVPPLDGSWVARLLLPRRWREGRVYAQIAQWGLIIFAIMVGLTMFTPLNVIGLIIGQPIQLLQRLIVGRVL